MSYQHISFTTSIELANKQKYSNLSVTSRKRFWDDPAHEARVFGDVSSNNTGYKRQRIDLVEKNRFEASEIDDIDAGDSVKSSHNERDSRPTLSPTQPSALNPLLSLSHHVYGLPETLVGNFASLGIKTIYPWQSSCLLGRGILAGNKNLVYTAPTGGGKSLVADVLLLKKVVENPSQKAKIGRAHV